MGIARTVKVPTQFIFSEPKGSQLWAWPNQVSLLKEHAEVEKERTSSFSPLLAVKKQAATTPRATQK